MNRSRLVPVLTSLLLLSLGLNVWQVFLRPSAAPGTTAVQENLRTPANERAAEKPRVRTDDEGDEETKIRKEADVQDTEWSAKDLATVPEEDLLFGAFDPAQARTRGEPTGRVTRERLKELAKQEPSQAKKFRVQVVLHLPGDRKVDLGHSDIEAGSHMVFQRLREFPFPTGITLADPSPSLTGSFPVTPTTPGEFAFRNYGIEIDVDVTPAAGTLVLGGQVTHRVFAGFARMPGEAFSPVYTKADGGVDVILTENKVIQPQFNISESPFLAAATLGEPCRVPVRMAFGQTVLELTCTPVE